MFERVDTEMQLSRRKFLVRFSLGSTSKTKRGIEIANGVSYGLVAGVYTQDISRALRLARRLKTGSVWINGWYMGGVQAPTVGQRQRHRARTGPGRHPQLLQIKNIGIRL